MKTHKLTSKLINSILSSLVVVAFIATPSSAKAIKAKPRLIEYNQPDGSTILIRQHGDERAHFASSEDGYLVLGNETGCMEYAVLDDAGKPVLSGKAVRNGVTTFESGMKLISAADYIPVMKTEAVKTTRGELKTKTRASESDSKYIYSSCAFPTKGNPHSIVVLVEFSDITFSMDDPWDYYNDYLNGDDFSRNGATGSCRRYFTDSSLGKFIPTFDLYGPVKLQNNQRYYGQNDRSGDEPHAAEIVVEAVKYLDNSVDFSQYDHNGDGYVDSIYVIYAGQGEADGGSSNTIWPHSWELSEAANAFKDPSQGPIKVDNVIVDAYGCSNELSGRTPTGIGNFCHEFGHVMGLPDLYNTANGNDNTTPLEWSIMDEGSYNNNTRTPPVFSAFERYSLGWIEPEEIYVTGDYKLENLLETGRAYILTTEENSDEFFMLENRQKKGWDAYLPSHGMLVWHIDFDQKSWDWNTPNNNVSHQRVAIVPADNIKHYDNASKDTYPGMTLNTELSTTSRPALLSYDKNELNVKCLSNITEVGDLITFHAEVGEDRFDKLPAGIIDSIENAPEIWVEAGMIHSCASALPVFDISGRKIGIVEMGSPLSVPAGIYIVGGRKLFIR